MFDSCLGLLFVAYFKNQRIYCASWLVLKLIARLLFIFKECLTNFKFDQNHAVDQLLANVSINWTRESLMSRMNACENCRSL